MTVAHILKEKGNAVVSVQDDATILDAMHVLADKRIGAVLVMSDAGAVAGVLSERDIVRGLAVQGPDLLGKPVSAVMTREVITTTPETPIASVMNQMTANRIRHLPVLNGDTLVGVISIGDVVKHRIAETEHEAEALRDYIATG